MTRHPIVDYNATSQGTSILETEHLRLRQLVPSDLEQLAVLYRDPDIRRYFPEGILTYDETREELAALMMDYAEYGYGLWATLDKTTGKFIGRCGLIPWPQPEGGLEVEVAYLFEKSYWGKGLGKEVAQAILRYGFETVNLPKIICMMLPENVASEKIAQGLGMKLERIDPSDNSRIYAIDKETYAHRS